MTKPRVAICKKPKERSCRESPPLFFIDLAEFVRDQFIQTLVLLMKVVKASEGILPGLEVIRSVIAQPQPVRYCRGKKFLQRLSPFGRRRFCFSKECIRNLHRRL